MNRFKLLHVLGSFAPVVLFLGTTGIISAQMTSPIVSQTTVAQASIQFSSISMSYSSFSSYPRGITPYTQCVDAAIHQREQELTVLEESYAQQKLSFVRMRAEGRINAWTIPMRKARRDAERSVDRGFSDAVRALNKWFRPQERAIYDAFGAVERECKKQFNYDVDPSTSSSSSSTSSSSSSSTVSCMTGDVCVPVQYCSEQGGVFKNPGACGTQEQRQSGYYCCQLQQSSSSSWAYCGDGICQESEAPFCPPCLPGATSCSCSIGTCPQDCARFQPN